jgi:hypothetical protein
MHMQDYEVRPVLGTAEVRGIGNEASRNPDEKDRRKRTKPQEHLGSPTAHVCSTPVLNSGMTGFSAAASRAQIRASRVRAGSMMASTHRRAAA